MADDFSADTRTTGSVGVGGSTRGEIEQAFDRDWFAVMLQAGRPYQIDLEGSRTTSATLSDPFIRGVFDRDSRALFGSSDDDGGVGLNSRLDITVDQTATYYVSAGAFSANTGSYVLSVQDVGQADDYASTTDTDGTVSVGGSVTGSIEQARDQDWFRVELTGGRTYRIDVEGAGTTPETLRDPYLRGLHDADGTLLPGSANDDGGEGLNSREEVSVGTSGTYYIAAGAFGSNTGSYQVSIQDLGALDDHPDSPATGGQVAVGGAVTGTIEQAGDRDWYQVQLTAGRAYQVDLEGARTNEGSLSDPYLRGLYDADGDLVRGTGNDDGGDGLNSRDEITVGENGTYYLAAGAYGANTGSYTLSVQDLGVLDDFRDTTETTGSVAVGGSADGEIEEPHDRDWFAVELDAGRAYQIDLESARTGQEILRDPYIRGVHDSSGDLVPRSSDDDGGDGLESRLELMVPQDGTYYVAAGAYGSNTGRYTLSVADLGLRDDYADDTGTNGRVPDSGVVGGEIEQAQDRDWFAVEFEAGNSYRIALEGSYGGGGSLPDPYLRGIYDANGTLISGTLDDDGGGGLDSLLEFEAGAGGRHYISAGAFGSSTGTYTLTVTDLGDRDDYAADLSTDGSVAVDGMANGSIEAAGDQDWFAVRLQGGTTYTLDLEGVVTGGGTLSDPYLRGVHDSRGTLIRGTLDDDDGVGLNSQLEFTPNQTGTYYISAGAYGSNTGSYSLSVAGAGGAGDDFAADTGTSGRVTAGGAETGSIETAGDQDWFQVTLQAGQAYQIDLEGRATQSGTLSDPLLRGLYDGSGNLISGTGNDDGGRGLNSQVTVQVDSTGTYYVGAGAYGSNTGSYKVSVTDLGARDDFSADTTNSGSVAVDGQTTGEVETSGDRDWHAVTLQEGDTYTIDLEGAATQGGTLTDPRLFGLHDTRGDLISGTGDDDGGRGLNSQLTYTAESTGTHYVSAGAYGSNTGSYKLSVSQVATGTPSDDFGTRPAEAGSVTPGTPTTGEIEVPSDRDWFAASLQAGETYRIDLEGAPTDAGDLADPLIANIFDARLNPVTGSRNDDGGTGLNSRLDFTPDQTGTYYIAAGSSAGAGSYKLSVTTTGTQPQSAFDIDVDFSGNPQYRTLFDQAAETWESVITGDLPSVANDQFGIVDDLRIDASVVDIDGRGGILGQAGPRDFRPGSALPYNGMMQFDTADLAVMEQKGILLDVIEHEMGHVLGLGTLWDWLGLSQSFRYTGANAVREYASLSGRSETSVPLETTGGPGTAGSHWAESVFDTELMTGYAENSPPMPLSRLTIGSLEDLGYDVAYGQAEPFQLSGVPAVVAGNQAGQAQTMMDGGAGNDPVMEFGRDPAPQDRVAGPSFINFEDKPIELDAANTPFKLDGPVTEADEATVMFFETSTGNDYAVELRGSFEKNDPATAEDVKGTLNGLTFYAEGVLVANYDFSDRPRDVETTLANWTGIDLAQDNLIESRSGTAQNDVIAAGEGDDRVLGRDGDDRLDGGDGNDDLRGGDGRDTLIGGAGDDTIAGGDSSTDRRDEVFAGAGNDQVDGGHGNDELNGGTGNDTLAGGFGADDVFGNAGDDVMTGSAFSDLLFGGPGFDFVNGGFGFDRVNGGDGGDRFFHTGDAGHGSDWIQDYNAGEGDVLVYGDPTASRGQFQVNTTLTENAGQAGVEEAFVIYRPTGQILWALVDGAGQDSLNLRLGGQDFDLFG